MTSRTFLGVLAFSTIAASSLGGCGGGASTSTGGGGNGGSSSSSTSSSTSASSSTSTSTSSSSSSSGSTSSSSSSSSGGPLCTDFTPPPPMNGPVMVRLVNKTGSNVYLGEKMGGCDPYLGFTLEDASMTQLKPNRGLCDFTCEELQSGTCGCPAGCAAPIVTLLGPDQHYDIGWPGSVFVAENMPAKCYMDATCATSTCLVEQTPPAGPLTIKASAWTQAVCPGNPNNTCVDCVPGLSGSCVEPGAQSVSGTEIKGKVTYTNGMTMVEVDFM